MKISQFLFEPQKGWKPLVTTSFTHDNAPLVLIFGSRYLLENESWMEGLRSFCPEGHWIIASTSGEIYEDFVTDDTIVATALSFEQTRLQVAEVNAAEFAGSYSAGVYLGKELGADDLQYVLLISDGQAVNGSQLVEGMGLAIPQHIPITGGMAGDAARFEKTLVGYNRPPVSGQIIAVGFYGDRLQVGHGSVGGWEMFGPDRIISHSEGNVLYELDGQNALDLYKRYLGDYAKDLPGSALLFPLNIWLEGRSEPLTRTILSVDEEKKSMTFAGDVPQHARVRFMKANFDKLIDGSESAARDSVADFDAFTPDFALLISCVGRKLILGQRVEEEVEVVRGLIGTSAVFSGFYSYGEICPNGKGANCELHNQTMTITTLKEL